MKDSFNGIPNTAIRRERGVDASAASRAPWTRAAMDPIDLTGMDFRRRFGYRVKCVCGREVWAMPGVDALGWYLRARPHLTPEWLAGEPMNNPHCEDRILPVSRRS